MKKIFTTATLALLSIMGMSAQTTIYSWESPQGTPIETGGTIAYVNGDGDRLNYPQADYYTICLNGKKANMNDATASANAGKMVITLDQPLQAGDVINITAFINKNESKKSSAYIVFETGATAETEAFSDESNIGMNGQPTTKTVTVAAAAAGSKTVTLTRGQTGTNLFIIKLTITREGGAEPTTVTFDFSDPNFRENIGEAMTDTKGFIYNEIFTVGDVDLQITGGSAPSRIYVDNNRGQNLVTYKEYTTLTFRAPRETAITKIEFVAAGNSNINNFTASSGTIEDMTWTGNAGGVRFQQGGTSYLAKAIVTLVDMDANTAALPAIEYTEVANIAAFNALENGTYAKLTLTDAEITGKSADGYSTVFIQDATGGCWIQYTSLNDKLQEKTKVSGTIYTVKRTASGNPQIKEAEDTPKSELTAEAINDYTMVSGTIAEVNVAANLNRVVKISGATLEMTSATAGKLTQGESTIDVNNGNDTANQQLHKIAGWEKNVTMENVTMVAILVAKSNSANQLLPISLEGTTVGISTVTANSTEVNIFNLQGQRMNSVQKGLYIINGKKVMVK